MIGKISFNSQRDGILHTQSNQSIETASGFQFPTGWNSTISHYIASLPLSYVSIPNGMEFYNPDQQILNDI